MLVDIKTKILVLSRVIQELTKDKRPTETIAMIQNIHNQTVDEIYSKTIANPKCNITVVNQ